MLDKHLTELQQTILEIEELGLPLRDAMRLATQRVGYFVGQQRYRDELAKARRILAEHPELAEALRADRHERVPRSATHQIGSTGG